MFDPVLDSEHPFGQRSTMHRTFVRRRRITAVAVVSLVALAVPAGASAFGGPPAPPIERRYVVQGGDTLWAVAARLAPEEDPRETVSRLIEENRLDDAAIVPGQVLRLDVG